MMCFSDGSYPEMYEDYVRKAREPHQCCECRRTIESGERYHAAFGVWEGYADRFNTCRDCMFDRCRVRTIEHMEGCVGAEAEPAFCELREAMFEMGMEPSRAPPDFDFERLISTPIVSAEYREMVPTSRKLLLQAASSAKLGRGWKFGEP